MSPLVAYHATNRRSRTSIANRGLFPAMPAIGRPFGVYVFREDDAVTHSIFSRTQRLRWTSDRGQDVWEVSYIGPITPDHYVENGLVLLGRVTHVSLVAGNNGH
jgi:hypothetical protein